MLFPFQKITDWWGNNVEPTARGQGKSLDAKPLASEAADGAERSCGRGPSGWITCVGFVVFGLAVSKYQSGEGTKNFVGEPRVPQALDYGLASSFEKLRAQRQPMIQEISEQLGSERCGD